MKVLAILGAILVGFALVTLVLATRQKSTAEATHPPAGQFIEVNGTRVHYIEAGSGPPLVLIHGASGNVNDWRISVFDALSAHFRVIAFDRPGLGYTDPIGDAASPAAQARLLAEAATRLGADRPLVMGHSYGGTVALAWALERPDAVSGMMVLSGASHPWNTGVGAYYGTLSHPVTGPIMAHLIAAYVPQGVVERSLAATFPPQSPPEAYGDRFGVDLSLRTGSMYENARQRASLLPHIQEMAPRYGTITVPVEIVHGDADPTVPLVIHSEPLARALPDGQLTILEGVGHMPQHVVPDQIEAALLRLAARAELL